MPLHAFEFGQFPARTHSLAVKAEASRFEVRPSKSFFFTDSNIITTPVSALFAVFYCVNSTTK